MGEWFSEQAPSGSLLLAVPVALVAGLVSFFSPCVIPLLPGYLSYATGLSGADLQDAEVTRRQRPRMLAGSLLFVLGFTVVFVLIGLASGALGARLLAVQRELTVVLGVGQHRARSGVPGTGAVRPARLARPRGAGRRAGRGAAPRLPVRARLGTLRRPDPRP